jgi:rhodanese-related sulfurtransferase
VTPSPLPTVDPRAIGDDLLVDVREDDEWVAGHAPDAVHLPMSQLPARLAELPDDVPVAVVCRSGHRSAQVTAYLVARGRSARNVDGGMSAWASLGLPVEAEGGRPPRIV